MNSGVKVVAYNTMIIKYPLEVLPKVMSISYWVWLYPPRPPPHLVACISTYSQCITIKPTFEFFSVKLQKVCCDLTDVQNSWPSIFHELTYRGLSTDSWWDYNSTSSQQSSFQITHSPFLFSVFSIKWLTKYLRQMSTIHETSSTSKCHASILQTLILLLACMHTCTFKHNQVQKEIVSRVKTKCSYQDVACW